MKIPSDCQIRRGRTILDFNPGGIDMCIDVENNTSFNINSDSKVYNYFDSNVKNKLDIRTQLAYDIIYLNNGVYKISKDTRAGVTTSMQGVCLEEHIPYIIIEPTNSIIRDTNIRDVKRIFNKPDAKIVHIPSNFECIINQELFEDYPNLQLLQFLLVGESCSKCEHFNVCPLTEIHRVENPAGLCITYSKLVALSLAASLYPESIAASTYEKLTEVKVRILDEVHDIAFDRMTVMDYSEQTAIDIKALKDKIVVADKAFRNKSFRLIRAIINRYLELVNDPELLATKEIMKNVFESSSDIFKKKHSVKIQNNHYNAKILPKLVTNIITGKKELKYIDESNVVGLMIKELVKLVKIIDRFNINISDVNMIYSIVNIIFSKELNIEIAKKYDKNVECKYHFDFHISAIDHQFKKAISEYLEYDPYHAKTFLVSATHTKYDYQDLFYPETIIKNITFGKNGDPMNANSKMKIFSDSKTFNTFGKNNFKNHQDKIVQQCKDIMDIYGKDEKVIIVCMNISHHNKLKKNFEKPENSEYHPKISYYRCPDMMGVTSNCRVGIHIGLGYIPSHAFDSIRKDQHDARVLTEEKMHCDSWQAMSRVKDPEGKEPSVVFALGCTKRDLDNITSWASDGRLVDIIDTGIGRQTEKNVTLIGEHISKPEIIEAESWNETLIQSAIHMYGLSKPTKIDCYKCSNLINLNKEYFIVNSKAELLNKVFEGTKYKTQFKYKNGGYSKKDVSINEHIINEHTSGNETYYFRPVLSKKTNTISFETDSKIDLNKLKLFLDTNDVPYVIEKLDNYRIWIFIRESPVSLAKKVVYLIIDEVGNNYKINLSDELIKLPFCAKSEILVNGEVVNYFVNFRLGIVDISDFETAHKRIKIHPSDDENKNDEGSCSSSQK